MLLIALHFTHTFEVLDGTWVLLLITMALGFIQWLVIITVYWEYDDEGPRKPASAALKIASIIPTVITIALIVVALVAKFDFVNTTASNFFLSLAMCCGAMLVGYVLASGIGRIAEHLVNGCAVEIPQNTWFVGTANKDDSTFTITDKVYDRAVIIDFAGRNESASDTPPVAPIHIGATALASKFNQAVATSEFNLTREDYERFSALGNFMSEKFDITFGNRVLNQIVRFVPVYVACCGTANKALDIMFARKILRKLDGRFDDSLKGNLTRLETLIRESYGADDFALSMEAIAKLKRKLI